jgi:bifunctional DNA-binding transcriptional regulator/antitoxin component of YhaV-PrlF toxin-antitoxin module
MGRRQVYLTIVLLGAMGMAKTPASTVSNKGQIILPKAIGEAKGRGSGTKLVVGEAREGVLRAAWPFRPITPEDVFGGLDAKGKRLSDEDIEKALRAAAKRRYARD